MFRRVGIFMGSRKYIFFVFIYLTSCLSESQNTSKQQPTFSSKYYCEEFSITPPSGRNWRSIVLNELTPEKYPLFFNPKATSDLIKYCPNLPNLDNDQKRIVLLRILDAMVFFESSCEVNAAGKGPNGTAYGLLQLHLGREQDYQRSCRKNDSKSSQRSLVCGLQMIHEQVDEFDKIFYAASYWEVLRPKGRSMRAKQVASHIWYYPLCQGQPEDTTPITKKTSTPAN